MRRNEQKPRTIRFQFTPPEKEGERWRTILTATVATGSDPHPDVDVQFYLKSTPVDSPVATDGEGRALKELLLSAGTHVVEAKIVGATTSSQQTIRTGEKAKKPATISCAVVRPAGSDKIVLTFLVLTEDKDPVPKATIRISDPDQDGGFLDVMTDEKGIATCDSVAVTKEQRQKSIKASVLGSSVATYRTIYYIPTTTARR